MSESDWTALYLYAKFWRYSCLLIIFEYVGKDEAYLDVTKRVEGDFEKASYLAQQIKNSIRDKVKLSCSIGISSNKLISKL